MSSPFKVWVSTTKTVDMKEYDPKYIELDKTISPKFQKIEFILKDENLKSLSTVGGIVIDGHGFPYAMTCLLSLHISNLEF